MKGIGRRLQKEKRIGRGKELVKSSLAKLVWRWRIHFLQLSFDVTRGNVSGMAMASARVWENYFRPRVIQERGGNKAKGGGREGGGGGGGEGDRGNESNELPRQIFSASLSQRNRLRCDFVVAARDQSFSRAPFSNSTYQSGTFPSPSVNFIPLNTCSFLFPLSLFFPRCVNSRSRSPRFVEFSI